MEMVWPHTEKKVHDSISKQALPWTLQQDRPSVRPLTPTFFVTRDAYLFEVLIQ